MPEGITTGPDGALWFTNTGNSSIGRITTSGVVTNYTSGSVTDPTSITAGPDGALWFTNGDSIGRITAVPSASVSPSSGSPGSPVAVSGSGYTPGEQIDVTYETGLSSPAALAICSATAEPNGTFSCTGDIPAANSGSTGKHKIEAQGMTSLATAKATFTLT